MLAGRQKKNTRRGIGPNYRPGTHSRDRHLILSVPAGHVWRILRQLGWSPQRPVGRALERDEAAIEHWKKKAWPGIKEARQQGRTIVLIEESEFSQRPIAAALGAPGGQTSVLFHPILAAVITARLPPSPRSGDYDICM